jgi:uncharacterized protein YggE
MSLFGQTKIENVVEQPYIEVTGTAEKEIIPDEIYIGIVIREKYVGKVKTTIEEQEGKLKEALKTIGIDLANLYMSDVNADYIKISWQKKDLITKKNYSLKVSDATTAGKVFQVFEQLEITDAYIAKVNHSKMDSLLKEVKMMAIKAAKEKADYLLKAIGEQTGKPLIINEISTGSWPLSNVSNVRGNRSDNQFQIIDGVNFIDGEIGNYEIQFQKIKIQSTIYVKFSIK